MSFQTFMRKREVGKRAKAGMRLLDRKGPPDWRSKVDLDRLDISEPFNCILGQAYGNYVTGLNSLGLVGARSFDHGFCGYSDVTDRWKKELSRDRVNA